MAKKRNLKLKEPVRIRFRKLANGNQSIYLDVYLHGKRETETLSCLYLIPEITDEDKKHNIETLRKAKAIQSQRIWELINNEHGFLQSDKRSKMLLFDWMQEYRNIKAQTGQSESFALNIDKVIKHLHIFCGTRVYCMKDIDKQFCLDFIQYLRNAKCFNSKGQLLDKPLKQITAGTYLRNFIAALNKAVEREIISRNPFDNISSEDKIKRIAGTREYLTEEEVKLLIQNSCYNNIVKNAFLFACFTGLRHSDVENLKWEDIIKTDNGWQIRIVQTKTKEPNYIDLLEEAFKFLPPKEEATDNEKVFDLPSHQHTNLLLKTWAKVCGITKVVTFHVARHTFATMLLNRGVDINVVRELLGQKDIASTLIYAKITRPTKLNAINALKVVFD